MRSKMFVGALWILAVLAVGTVATSGDPAPARQSAIVYVAQPTLIGSTIVEGPVLFTHDDARMRRGEPCTTVYLFEPGRGPAEAIASFHCIPARRPIVSYFTMRTRPNEQMGYGCVLTEYQFAGDAEGHGVPLEVRAH
jgi:hypothetical protein